MNVQLSPRTAMVVADYAKLVGLSPAEFVNSFLETFLVNPRGLSTGV